MSTRWLAPCWATETGSPARKSVLAVLADHADEDGYSWPRVKTIAALTELAESTVRRVLTELEDGGFIERIAEYEPAGRQTSNTYRITVNRISPPITARGGRVSEREAPPLAARGSTRTPIEPAEGSTEVRGAKRRRRAPAAEDAEPARRRGMRVVRSDEEGGDSGESPALGAAPRPSRASRDETAVKRGQSGYGLAMRMERGLVDKLAGTQVNKAALAGRLSAQVKNGRTWEELREMVDLFCAAPARYTHGDQKAWTAFLASTEKLAADVGKSRRASGAAFTDPYAGLS